MKKQTKRTNNQKNAKHSKSGLIAFVANNFKYILATIAIIIAIIAVFFGESKLIFSDTKSANVNFNILYYRNVQTEERFLTLADAVANAESLQNSGVYATNTIQVINGGTETTAVTIPAGKNIVLDLNGKDITLNNVSITNNGTLTITGDSGKITGGTADTIINNGTFTKNGESNIESTSTDGSVAIPFRNNTTGTATLNAGTIAYTNETITADRFAIVNDGTLTIDGATVDSTVANSTYEGGIYNHNTNSKLTISSGTVQASATTIYNVSNANTSNNDCSIMISGGTIHSENYNAITNYNAGRIYITGEDTLIESENESTVVNTYSSMGVIEVNGGEITSNGNGCAGIVCHSGTVTITGGEITGTNGFGIYQDGGTVILGNKTDATVADTTKPKIKTNSASNYGVYLNGGTFKFYDGIIYSPTVGRTIRGTVADTPEGYSVVNGTEVIDGTTYETATLDNQYTVSFDENINYFNQMENTLTGFTGASNYYKKIGEIDISNISLNDTVTFEADVSYENLTANTENNYFIIFQNYGYATRWSEAYYNSSFYKFLGTGTAKVKWSWTFDNSRFNENDFYACLLRTDYYTGGTITLSNIKVTKQNSTKQVTYGETYGTLPTLTRTGYTFDGWYTDPVGGTQITSSTPTPATDTTYYAHWTKKYTIKYNAGNLLYGLNDCGETLGPNGAFSAPSYFMKYSISDKVVTATALQNDGYGMTSGRVDLEANREYVFSCTTNGTLGHSDSEDTIEIYLCKDGLIDTYYRMDTNNNFKFTPTVSGTYWLRLDVNQNGKTHTFSNITVTYADEANKEYGTAYGTLPNPSIEGYTFNGWYANAVKATTLIDNYEVSGQSIGYNTSYIVSEMIPIEGGTTLYSNIPICGIYTYDINKTRINRESNRVTTHPISSNAKYIRIEICKTDDNQTLSYYQDNLVISDYQHLADITYKNDQITSSTTNTIPSDHTLFAKWTDANYGEYNSSGVWQKGYTTLSDAFAGVTNGNTIKPLTDTTEPATTLASGKTATLNLNGKTITLTGELTNNGNLTVTDTTASHTKTSDGGYTLNVAGTLSSNVVAIQNYGTLNIAENAEITGTGVNSTIVNSKTLVMTSGTVYGKYTTAIHNGAGGLKAKAAISGGTVISREKTIVNRGILAETNDANPLTENVLISGTAKIVGEGSNQGNAIVNDTSTGKIKITGGELTSTGTVTVSSTENSDVVENNSGIIEITGGKIEGKVSAAVAVNTGTVTICGGEITAVGHTIWNNKGNVTIGSSGVGTQPNVTCSGKNAIRNEGTGTVAIQGGTITGATGQNAILNADTGTIIISGGNISTTNQDAVANNSTGTITITGGTIATTTGGAGVATANGNVTITGGTITAAGSGVWINKGTVTIGSSSDTTQPKITSLNRYGIYLASNADVTVLGGTITALANDAIRNNEGNGTITVSGGTITSSSNAGLSSSVGTVSVTGGQIIGKTYGIYLNNAQCTMGKNDSTVSTTTPYVNATAGVGVHYRGNSATFAFYDGIIIGNSGQSIADTSGNSIEPTTVESGYTRKITDRGDGTEASTLGWETTASDTQLINDSSEYTATRSAGSTSDVYVKEWTIAPPFSANEVYQVEFDAKGSGTLWNFFYGASGYWGCAKVESLDGTIGTGWDGRSTTELQSDYTHYEIRFTLASSGNANVNKRLLFRLDTGEADAYIKNIKFYKINSTFGTNAVNNLSTLSISSPKLTTSLKTVSTLITSNTTINDIEETETTDNIELTAKENIEDIEEKKTVDTEENKNENNQNEESEEKTEGILQSAQTKQDELLVENCKVAEISGTSYSTIIEAIQAANSGDTIKLLEDVSLEESLVIPEDKSITIDLNGKTLTSSDTSTITNNGELTITSNVDSELTPEEKGTLTNESKNGTVIVNNGELVVDKIQIIVSKEGSVGINNIEGTVTLGVDESKETDENGNTKEIEVNTEIPVIYATGENTTALINSKKGIIYFYDGRIVSTSTIKNIITSVLENYEINEEFNSNNISSTLRLIMNKKEGSDK